MSAEDADSSEETEFIGTRCSEEFKRSVRLRAAELNMNQSEYIKKVLREDFSDSDIL